MSNEKIPETDQWKLDGDCDKCRKKNYCSKECKAAKVAFRVHMMELVNQMIKGAEDKAAEKNEENNDDK